MNSALPERVAGLLSGVPEWYEAALCAQADPEVFYPAKGESTKAAKTICGRCDVRDECLLFALGRREPFGVWGGLSERERRKLLRRAR